MAVVAERARPCPRCRYDLRGQAEPRCPECGLMFPAEDWDGGILREYVPARMDRVDPWQPHQVLWAGLVDMLYGLVRPQWVFTQLDPRGSLGRAVLGAMLGLLWLYLTSTALASPGIAFHQNLSPRMAVVAALTVVAPRILASWGSIACAAAAFTVALMRPAGPPWHRTRACLFLIPSLAFGPVLASAATPLVVDGRYALLARTLGGLAMLAVGTLALSGGRRLLDPELSSGRTGGRAQVRVLVVGFILFLTVIVTDAVLGGPILSYSWGVLGHIG